MIRLRTSHITCSTLYIFITLYCSYAVRSNGRKVSRASHDAFNFIARKSLNRFSIAEYVVSFLKCQFKLNSKQQEKVRQPSFVNCSVLNINDIRKCIIKQHFSVKLIWLQLNLVFHIYLTNCYSNIFLINYYTRIFYMHFKKCYMV